ncbi:MAG: hypothetical protein PUI24_03435 [Spirochaetales bacterium]|nr:hypothetical protein [Spirochaetia bacterium]MDD7014019.1 hypothetical protein [Spirochaetales bacterium]
MNDREEITFDKVEGIGVFKFTYYSNGERNGENFRAECIANEEDDDIFAQELLLKLQSKKNLTDLRAYKSIAEYEY